MSAVPVRSVNSIYSKVSYLDSDSYVTLLVI